MEFFRYIYWVWSRWEFWQRTYILALGLIISSIAVPESVKNWLIYSGISIILIWTFKWIVWDSVVHSWKKYCNERDNLFKTIKGE